MGNVRVLLRNSVCVRVPVQANTTLPALRRKEAHAHAWREAVACSSLSPAWTALGSGHHRASWEVSTNLPNECLFWIGTFYFPEEGRGISYFIANVCNLILCC